MDYKVKYQENRVGSQQQRGGDVLQEMLVLCLDLVGVKGTRSTLVCTSSQVQGSREQHLASYRPRRSYTLDTPSLLASMATNFPDSSSPMTMCHSFIWCLAPRGEPRGRAEHCNSRDGSIVHLGREMVSIISGDVAQGWRK